MRYFRLTVIFFCTFLFCLTAEAVETKTVTSTMQDATIYLKGASITRDVAVSVRSGVTEVIVEGLSNHVDANSVQVKGTGSAVIQSVHYQINHVKRAQPTAEVQALEDSVELLEVRLEQIQSMRRAYEEEEAMLKANRSIKGEQSTLSMQQLRQAGVFFRERMQAIFDEVNGLKRQEKEVNKRLQNVRRQLSQLRGKENRPSGEVVIKLSANRPVKVTLELQYYVRNAGWEPVYDIRAKSVGEPVQLHYKANVWQNTGVDWKALKPTLATGDPSRSGTRPVLSTWWLDFVKPPPSSMHIRGGRTQAEPMYQKDATSAYDQEALEKAEKIATAERHTQVTEQQLATRFFIDLPYDIPSDGKKHLVEVQKHELPATYRYYAAPKLDKEAFLVAEVTGWEAYNLLTGQANIFFEEAYVGQSVINTRNTEDTLLISLGRDPAVVIEREKNKDFTRKKFLGGNKQETYGYVITVRNTKNKTVDITVEDQIPVSKQKTIKVELEERGDAALEAGTGKLTWKLNMAPSKSEELTFRFTIEYPKEKRIPNF